MILPLTLDEIKSIHDAYTAFISKNGSHVDLSSIASKIEEGIKLIREKTGNDCKVFTRLSSRSPKGGLISEKKKNNFGPNLQTKVPNTEHFPFCERCSGE